MTRSQWAQSKHPFFVTLGVRGRGWSDGIYGDVGKTVNRTFLRKCRAADANQKFQQLVQPYTVLSRELLAKFQQELRRPTGKVP